MDRASAYADPETVELLTKQFIPVGISLQEVKSQYSQIDVQETRGFFDKIVNQRAEPKHSKQGFYIASPDGTLVKGWMYPRPDTNGTVKKNLKEALAAFQPPAEVDPMDYSRFDRAYKGRIPTGAVVVETRSKLFDKPAWPAAAAERFEYIKKTMGHDRLWILQTEVAELARGSMPHSLLERIVRFHLGDNTRCYLDRWAPESIQRAQFQIQREGGGFVLTGSVLLEHESRGFDAALYGRIETKGAELTRFDVVAYGSGWGQHNGVNYAPLGKFHVGNAFTMAKPGVTFDVLPVWNWVPDYLKTSELRLSQLLK